MRPTGELDWADTDGQGRGREEASARGIPGRERRARQSFRASPAKRRGSRCLPSLSQGRRNQADGAGSRLLGRARVTGRSGTGRGFQPAMVRAQARACVMSVMAGNSRRSSTAAENSPCCSKAASDGGGVCLGDDEHAGRMGVRARAGKHLRPDSLACRVPFMFPDMAANPPPWQRAAILASPLHELTGFYLAVDCLTSDCGRERFPSRNWRASMVRSARWARCCGACGAQAAVAAG